jgi:uncharacterized membrane protein YdjX (TVP38/TMEM64 family)
MHALLAESGAWGPLIYVAAFAVFEALGVPGAVFEIPASLAWPAEVAVTLSVFGATLAGILSFGMARWFVGDFARRHLPARLRRFTAQAALNPLRTVLVVRLLFFTAAPAHWALGVSGVPLAPFVIGSLIGFVPGMVVLVLGGRAAIEVLQRHAEIWPIALVVAGAGYLIYRWWFRRPPRRGPT